MSASSKKKIRKEQEAAKMTERQRKAQKEALRLKIYSIIFTVVIAAVLVSAIVVFTIKGIQTSGLLNKRTTALTIGDHKINSVEMNYYYMDSVTKTYNQWETSYGNSLPSMLSIMGLDLSKPLDEQPYYDEDKTWADYFMDMAIENAHSDYTLSDAAEAANFTMSESDSMNLKSQIGSVEMQAMMSNFDDVDRFIAAYYGPGSDYDSYVDYMTRTATASAYYTTYNNELTFTEDDVNAHADKHPNEYSSYSYAEYQLSVEDFLGEGTTDAEGNVTHTDEQTAAAKEAAKAAADEIAKATTLEELDAAIAAFASQEEAAVEEEAATDEETAEVTEEDSKVEVPTSTKHENILYSSLGEKYRNWLSEDGRKVGDIGVLEDTSTSKDDDGNEVATTTGYTVVFFSNLNDNKETMSNVRHLLVCPVAEEDELTGEEEISEEAWEAAKETAEMHLKNWKESDGTEEGFIELVKESSEDGGSVENGGLYENIHRDANYEEAFLTWAVDPARTKGETGIVKTSYGYHIMYYVGKTEITYFTYMITEELRAAALEAWYNSIKESATATRQNLSRVDTSTVLFNATGM